MKRILALSTLFLFLGIHVVLAQIPPTISYQGVLTDAGGNIVPDGNYTLTFKLYETPTGGTPFWQEQQNVAVANGIFNVILGSVTPLIPTV